MPVIPANFVSDSQIPGQIPGTVYLFLDANGSAASHISGKSDKLVNVDPLLLIIHNDRRKFLTGTMLPEEMEDIRKHERTGRPLGSATFVEQL